MNPPLESQEGVITDEESREETVEASNVGENSKLPSEEQKVESDHGDYPSQEPYQSHPGSFTSTSDPSPQAGYTQNNLAPDLGVPPINYLQAYPFQGPVPHMYAEDPVVAMHSFYEARMRDHAAAYANAAAGAAWAAAQIAQAAAAFASGCGPPPPCLPHPSGMVLPQTAWTPPTMYAPPLLPRQGYLGTPQYPPSYHSDPTMDPSLYHDDPQGRKRQERPPSDNDSASIPRVIHPSSSHNSHDPSKIRRRRYSQDDPSRIYDASSMSHDAQHPSFRRHGKHRHSSRQPHRSRRYERARTNDLSSLLGKTAVAALYEWCGKRHCPPPSFVHSDPDEGAAEGATEAAATCGHTTTPPSNDHHACIVYLDGVERGCGRGRTKTLARQDAARRALLTLVPGVEFDSETGLLIHLPRESIELDPGARNRAMSMDEELPNLAKRLAIGRDDDEQPHEAVLAGDSKNKRFKKAALLLQQPNCKRAMGLYPASSTTASEGDDENAYFKSKGANVCAVLLHAFVQISKFPAPDFQYDIAPLDVVGADVISKRRESELMAVRATRGPFICRAKWTIPIGKDETTSTDKTPLQDNEFANRILAVATASDGILETSGTGGTKREARHVASAGLLSLLFPECETIVEVKAAAEAMRESYADQKARKLQRQFKSSSEGNDSHDPDAEEFCGYLRKTEDPPIPPAIQIELATLVDHHADQLVERKDSEKIGKNELDLLHSTRSTSDAEMQRFQRQEQLDLMVEQALQTMYEKDECCATAELSEDDVGRTVLRRALPDDSFRIDKLSKFATSKQLALLERSEEQDAEESPVIQMQKHWPAIVLLLCRAVAPYDEPPLGCAVLTQGFSMIHGRILSVAHIASEPHLPKERFIECLSDFASAMNSQLEVERENSDAVYTLQDVDRIFASYMMTNSTPQEAPAAYVSPSKLKDRETISKLQSVQEESELSDSSVEKRPKRHASKPSKRSRFQ